MKVYLVIESIWLDMGEYSGGREFLCVDSAYSTPDKADRKIQILVNEAVNKLRKPTDPDEPIDRPKVEINREDGDHHIFEIEVTSTDEHEGRTYYVEEMEVE